MKKILIVSRCLEIGGAERALIGLLESLDYSKYQVDLFLCRQEGEFMNQIPCEVNLLRMNEAQYLGTGIKKLIYDRKWKIVIGRFFSKVHANTFNFLFGRGKENHIEGLLSHRYTYKFISKINPNITYDLAISFITPHYLVLNNVQAKKKIAWIHTDYSSIVTSNRIEYKMWSKFDYIASISNQCTNAFLSRFPTLKDKIIEIENISNSNFINKQANLFTPFEMEKKDDEIILCSVGRISTAKNFDNVPNICKRIIDSGLHVKWYIVGNGGIEKQVKENIILYGMEEHVIMLGKKDNPYPYIKASDYYIQPSRYEGKAVTVREAQILEKPVIITNYATSASQLDDGIDGVIVPMDNEGCAKGIVDFINNKELQEKIKTNLKQRDYSNASEVEKIYALMED